MRAMLLGGAMALFLGCGGSDGGSVSFSCNQGSSCTDLALTGADVTVAKADCTQNKGGTLGTACTHTGALGGCKLAFTGYGGSGTTTTWQYSGNASSLMSDCTTLHGTWVGP